MPRVTVKRMTAFFNLFLSRVSCTLVLTSCRVIGKSIKINGDQGGVEFIILSPKESTFITLFQNLILTPLFSEVEIANVSTRTLGLETELSIKAKLALKQK